MKNYSVIFLIGLILGFGNQSCTVKNTAKEQLADRSQTFDFDWRFALGDHPDASGIDFNDTEWRQLNLPHDWSIEGQRSAIEATGNDGGYFPSGIGWYRKTFQVPTDWQDQKVWIYFEGVYMNAEVFLNGHSLGRHPYGYTSFQYDLSPYLKLGEANVLAVKVDNSQQKNCRWYSGSGIYRHVWLTITSPVHIDQWGVNITTPAVANNEATVNVKTTIKNDTKKKQTFTLLTQLENAQSEPVGLDEVNVDLEAGSQRVLEQNIVVKMPHLWSTETPNLYNAKSSVKIKGDVVDQEITTFGIRSIEYSATKGFVLNGQTIKLNGGCVHHDNGLLGAASYDRAEERKAELLKAAGYNSVRTAHNTPSPAFLDACDRIGLLVIDESFDGWKEQKTPFDYASIFDEWWQRDIEAMVKRDRNHPSIIMWSSGNEIIERTKPEAVETAHMLNSYIRELDPTRPVTSAMTSWNQGWEIFDPLMAEHDICGYNYMMHESEADHGRDPERVIFQSESYPKDAFYNWNMVHTHDYIIGDYVWTALDYLGESSIGRYYYPGEPDGQHYERDFYPWHGAYCGDIDILGWRKPISHYRDLLWNDTEKLYMGVREPNPEAGEIKTTMWAVWPTWESWTWPGYEGKPVEVEVYSKYPKVRLYLNDQLLGEKATGLEQEFKAVFAVKYAKGTLKAVGVEGDNEIEAVSQQTAGKASKIQLTADRTTIHSDGQDLSYVTIEIVDEKGVRLPQAETELQIAIQGEGQIVGLGNANLKDEDPYVGNYCKTWKGRAQVVIKSTLKAGDIQVKVSAPDMPSTVLTLSSVVSL